MEASDTNLPKRKIKKTFRSVTGFFPSIKNGRSMGFESLLEKWLFLSLEFDDSVKKYLEQPITLEYKLKNRKYPYHPDCLIEYYDGSKRLIEAKYTTDFEEFAEELERKFNVAREYADKNGMVFDVFTENDITEIELSNFIFLYAFSSIVLSDEVAKKIKTILKKQATMTVSELLEELSGSRYQQAKLIPHVWKMVFDRTCHVDFKTTELSMNSSIGLAHE